jgi:hypothetical protein
MATSQKVVYDAIVRLGGARLGEIVSDTHVGRRTASDLIRKLAAKDAIFLLGKVWYSTSLPKRSGESGGNHVVIHGSENQLASMRLKTTPGRGGVSNPVISEMPYREALTIAGPQREVLAKGTDMYMPRIMCFILGHVADLRSKQNQMEGLKKSRNKHYLMKRLHSKETIEDMRDLVDSLDICACQGCPKEDFDYLTRKMSRLLPDWQESIRWAQYKLGAAREAHMVGEEVTMDPYLDPYEGAEILGLMSEDAV